ncbi:MAG: PASTA domain-containing protein [bacterium]
MNSRYFKIIKYLFILIFFLILGTISAFIAMKSVIQVDEVLVPNLVNKSSVQAWEELDKVGLNPRLSDDSPEYSEIIPENYIISQNPPANTIVKKGRNITVVISKGSEQVVIPNLVTESFYRVQTILKKNGLNLGRVTNVYHQSIPKDCIIAQVPLQQERTGRGSAVDLLVSKGKRTKIFIMPDIVGKDLQTATLIINNLGLYLGKIRYEFDEDIKENVVINQEPKAGYRAGTGDKVDLLVNKEVVKKNQEILQDIPQINLEDSDHSLEPPLISE